MRLLEPVGAPRLTVAAAGDIGLIGSARGRAAADGFASALAALAPAWQAADLGFANLEFPIAHPDWVEPGRSREFWHAPEVAAALVQSGVRVVSLANNHMMDAGPRGLERTLAACAAAGLATAGAGAELASARRPARLDVRGLRVAVLAYAEAGAGVASADHPGVAPLDPELMRDDIARCRADADVVIVSAHWGSMYVDHPPERVLAVARALAAAGADLVLGHHPHVVQGFLTIDRTLVLMSLGDAAFNCRAGDFHARVGAEVRLTSAVFTATLADRPGLDAAIVRLDADGIPGAPSDEQTRAFAERLAHVNAALAPGSRAFANESAAQLLRYELDSLGHYVRSGRWGRVARLLGSVRPRHLPVLWNALRRRSKTA